MLVVLFSKQLGSYWWALLEVRIFYFFPFFSRKEKRNFRIVRLFVERNFIPAFRKSVWNSSNTISFTATIVSTRFSLSLSKHALRIARTNMSLHGNNASTKLSIDKTFSLIGKKFCSKISYNYTLDKKTHSTILLEETYGHRLRAQSIFDFFSRGYSDIPNEGVVKATCYQRYSSDLNFSRVT